MRNAKKIISCDWGTTSFRLRIVNIDAGVVEEEVTSNKGIALVYDEWLQQGKAEHERIDYYKAVLQYFINQFKNNVDGLPVIISGMASSTIGIKELDYANMPFNFSAENLNTNFIKATSICPHDILLVSGLKTLHDVMRGEETMLLGCNFKNDKNALAIFPGTHSKHVIIKDAVAVGVKTYMTGEVFELLATKSVLSKSILKNNQQHFKSFEAGLSESAANNLLNSIFHVRTNQLFNINTAEENYYFLSGLIIGAELNDIQTNCVKIYLVCSSHLAKQYLHALHFLYPANAIECYDADAALINAHCKLCHLMQ